MGGNRYDDVNNDHRNCRIGGITRSLDAINPEQPAQVTCERCNGSGRYNQTYTCFGCAGTGNANTPTKRVICVKPFAKFGFSRRDFAIARMTTPAAYTGETRWIIRGHTLLERQVNEYFREVPRT